MQYFNINLTPDELLKRYKKFTFQTLKKFYTMLYVNADYFLILDSESMWIRETNMKDLFEDFLKTPFISASSISKRKTIDNLIQAVVDNANYLLNKNADKWFLENFVWFYEKRVLNDMFNEYGAPIQMAETIYQLKGEQDRDSAIFEIQLYQAYLYHNLDKYGHKFNDVDNILDKTLPNTELKIYLDNHNKTFNGNCGLLERTLMLLNQENYKFLANIFKEYSFNIIRCDYSTLDNISLQEKFIDIVKPNILAASQGHVFGANNKYKVLVKNKYAIKLEKHINNLIHPDKFSGQLLAEPISILFYLCKSILYVLKVKK